MKHFNAQKKALGFLTAAIAFSAFVTGCSSKDSDSSESSQIPDTTVSAETENTEATEAAAELPSNTLSGEQVVTDGIFSDRDLKPDYDSVTAEIALNGDSVQINGSGAKAEGTIITISEEGIYRITGTLNDGQIIIDADKAKVQLVLDNASISCSNSSAIYTLNAGKTFITLAEGSQNTVSDGISYSYADDTADEPAAAIFSEDSLTINGTGSLSVKGNYNDGIRCKDDIVITGGNLNIDSVGDGIKGKDYVAAAGGNITVNAGQDGIKSTNTQDMGMGFIYVEDGSFNITAQQDGIQTETVFLASGGNFDITSGGGSSNAVQTPEDNFGGMGGFGGGKSDLEGMMPPNAMIPPNGMIPPDGGNFGGFAPDKNFTHDMNGRFPSDSVTPDSSAASENSVSIKGIKSGTEVNISGGTFNINSADDALHSNINLIISGGSLTIEAGGDAVHADSQIDISGSSSTVITKSYEGIEAAVINVSGGALEVNSSDDAFNASDGTAQGAMGTYSANAQLNISGGTVYVNSDGDGLDSNGNMLISGGTVIVNGPTNNGNGALDGNNQITITGGLLIAAGSSGMAEYPDSSSTQNSVSANLSSPLSGGTLVTVTDSSGNEVISFAPEKTFSSIVISSPDIKSGGTYTLYTGGSTSSSEKYGLCETGGYNNDGTEVGSFTADNVTSFIGTQSMLDGGHGGMQGGGFGGGRGERPDRNRQEIPTQQGTDDIL